MRSSTRRPVFLLTIVERDEPLRGSFVYQRKAKADEWEDIRGERFTPLKNGEGWALKLYAEESRRSWTACSRVSSYTNATASARRSPRRCPAMARRGPGAMRTTTVSRSELLALADERRGPIRRYLQWALENERLAARADGWASSLRMERRFDIRDAADAAELFAERWWGVVVFTCFGSKLGSETVAPRFPRPRDASSAEAELERIVFPRGSVGHHRTQSTLKGAKQALVAACEHHAFFRGLLHSDEDFDERYRRLREASVRQWGRTTCFDLLLRAGALGVGGTRYLPELAYLAGSTGPSKGFTAVFGVAPDQGSAPWAEAVLQAWAEHWGVVAERVDVAWEGDALQPHDQENFLCVYQEQLARGAVRASC